MLDISMHLKQQICVSSRCMQDVNEPWNVDPGDGELKLPINGLSWDDFEQIGLGLGFGFPWVG